MITGLQANSNQKSISYRIPSEILSGLGIALTEVCFGRKISQMRIEEDFDPSGAEQMTNFNTATRRLPYIHTEMGISYEDAVRRCLKCPPDVRDANLDNEEFQAAVFDKIVTPLRDDFEIFTEGLRNR